jgi:hypothetical protein
VCDDKSRSRPVARIDVMSESSRLAGWPATEPWARSTTFAGSTVDGPDPACRSQYPRRAAGERERGSVGGPQLAVLVWRGERSSPLADREQLPFAWDALEFVRA